MNRTFRNWFCYSVLILASLNQARADSMTFYGELANNKIDVSDLAGGEGRALGHYPDLYVMPTNYVFEVIVVPAHKWNISGNEYEPKVVIKKSVQIPSGGEYKLITQDFESRDTDEEGNPIETESVDVKLKVVDVETETVATVPNNRKRKKLGVGEEVKLTLKPSYNIGNAVKWIVEGGGSVKPTFGPETTFTAGHQAGISRVKATFDNGMEIVNTFTVVEPSGILMEQEPFTEIWHIQGMASVGFRGRAYYKPTDVSFINIQVREQTVPGNGNGYYNFLNGEVHALGDWIQVVQGTELKGSKDGTYDQISAGAYPPPFAQGVFYWWIPWEYRLKKKQDFVKEFTTVAHYQEADEKGKVTLSKGGVNKSKNAEDPTSNY
ncbi:MAG: hypothetical protein R3F23_02800 [Verrucomicrobiia bacterium]